MIKYGADEVLRSKGGTITDEDIDAILKRGEEMTAKSETLVSAAAEESMYKFSMDGGMGSVYDWEDKDYKDANVGLNWVEPSKRDRKKNYNEDEYFRSLSSKDPTGAKLPKMPKLPTTHDFQFFNSSRLTELIEKERRAILAKHQHQNTEGSEAVDLPEIIDLTDEEQAEKEQLLSEGFHDWTKRDFNNYIRACEKYGRNSVKEIVKDLEGKSEEQIKEYHDVFWKRHHELEESDKTLRKIEDGEKKIQKREDIERLLKEKVAQSGKDPFNQLKISYGQNKGKAFTEEEDRYLLCMSQKLGYGNWEDLKAELRSAWQFRFDWFIKSRTPAELGRRVDSLIKMLEKENEAETASKDAAKKRSSSSGVKRKADDVPTSGKKSKK